MPYNHIAKFALLAAIGFAFSCSSNDDPKPPVEVTKYCVYKEMRTCHSTTQGSCPAGGELSDFCPYDGSSVASSSPSSSPSNPSVTSSSSIASNPNPNIVYGTPVTYNGETYKTVVIGSQTWFQRNLNYAVDGSKCNNNDEANCTAYGRLYDWNMAMTACPSGWRLPSKEDWDKLFHYADGTSGTESPYNSPTAGSKLKATSSWGSYNGVSGNGTDDYGFAALAGGNYYSGVFSANGVYATYWTSSEYIIGPYYIVMYRDRPDAYYNNAVNNNSMFSVRCMQGNSFSPTNSSSSGLGGGKGNNIANYKTKLIGDQVWMTENLDYNVSGSKCYENNEANCAIYGRLYNYSTAMTVCPSGWHIPTDAEWTKLTDFVGTSTAGIKLKSKSRWNSNGNGTDNYEFTALPGGLGNADGTFSGIGDYGYWWSSANAYYRYMYYGYEYVGRENGAATILRSVRCVQNSSSSSAPSSSSLASSSSSSIISSNVVYGTPVTYGGQTYQTVVIGTQTWFQLNLNYAAEGSKCYNDDPANCDKYGRLYNWVTAMALPDSCERKECASLVGAKHKGICPSGWHIPSKDEWTTLEDFVGGKETAGKYLKATIGWNNCGNSRSDAYKCEDTFGFSALPSGCYRLYSSCYGAGSFGYWWINSFTSRIRDNLASYHYSRDINSISYNTVCTLNTDETYLYSVRCLKD